MGVSKNRGVSPQIIHLFIGFSIIFTIHFGGPKTTPIFGLTPKCGNYSLGWKPTDPIAIDPFTSCAKRRRMMT